MKEISILTGSIFFTLAISHSGLAEALADKPSSPQRDPAAVQQIVEVDKDSLELCCKHLAEDKRRIHYVSIRRLRMSMQLNAIYTHEHFLFFRIQVSNHSNLDFAGDSIRFYIVDRRFFQPREEAEHTEAERIRRVARVMPLYIYGDVRTVKGRSEEETIIVLPRFTLPKRKRLLMVLSENNGGRTLIMHTGNHPLINAIPIEW